MESWKLHIKTVSHYITSLLLTRATEFSVLTSHSTNGQMRNSGHQEDKDKKSYQEALNKRKCKTRKVISVPLFRIYFIEMNNIEKIHTYLEI